LQSPIDDFLQKNEAGSHSGSQLKLIFAVPKPPPIMKFLFPTTISLDNEKYDYIVYEFKLAPGKYKAELTSPNKWNSIKEIIFWKQENLWTTSSRSRAAKHLAEILGDNIEHRKN
jgi:hypothetical protein